MTLPDSQDELLAYALNLASKGVQTDDGHQYLVHAHDLVDYAETIRALVADHKALRHMHNELRSVCNAHIAELEAEVESLTTPPADDEREALARILPAWDRNGYLVWEECLDIADAILAAGFRRQGPISDAQVEAALSAYAVHAELASSHAMRAALEAAREVQS